jgi:hypothetical protein
MRLTFLGKETQGGNSPTLWETDDGQYVIQPWSQTRTCSGSAWPFVIRCGTGRFPTPGTPSNRYRRP